MALVSDRNGVVGLVGGTLIVLVAASTRDSNSVPLLVIGAWWIAVGLAGVWQWRRVAREVRLEGDRVSFVFQSNEVTMPASDLIEIRRARGDVNRWLWLRVRTRSHGTIRVAARLRGLVDLLSELRRLNPGVTFPDL